jgi:hypothetical protein
MSIGGVSIILLLGILNLLLIVFQILTGYRIIKRRVGLHKKAGIALLAASILHGALAFIAGP